MSLAGAIVPFAIVVSVNSNTISGGEDFRGFATFLFGGLGLILFLCAYAQATDAKHQRIWGSLVALISGIIGFWVFAYFGSSLLFAYFTSVLNVFEFVFFTAGPVVGFVGGLWGVLQNRSWTQGATVSALAGPARRAIVGGSITTVLTLPFLLINGDYEWIFAVPALLVVVGGVSLYRGRRDQRVLGAVIIAAALVAGYPFYGIAAQLLFDLTIDTYILWATIALVGVFLAVMGGLQALRRRRPDHRL